MKKNIIHVLPGDTLTEKFKETEIEGEIIICRECLVEGDLMAQSEDDFWNVRAAFLKSVYGESEEKYFREVVDEFKKLENLAPAAEVNLWFEYELFCQANLWFCLSMLSNKDYEIYRLAPVTREENEIWKGFGGMQANELKECFNRRMKLSKADVQLGKNLWQAFSLRDETELKFLSRERSNTFPKLQEVCEAAIEIKTRPKETLREIKADGLTDFKKEIFPEFSRRAGVYGFGDSQVERILQEI